MRKLNHDPDSVAAARAAARLTQTQLAAKVGCSTSLISEIEGGTRNASPARLERLAAALGVTEQQLARKSRAQT